MNFDGKTIAITGGASGIGAAMVRAFAEKGARIVIGDVRVEPAQTLADEVGGIAIRCDVTRESDIQEMVSKAQTHFGSVDIFVSNAGVAKGEPDHAASASDEVWQMCWQVHVMAHVYAARAVLPAMIARRSGTLVQIASAAGLLSQIGNAAYSATKHAAVSFAESLAITHGDDGISVSVACPQYVATPLIGLKDEDADRHSSLITADQVATAVLEGVSKGAFLILPHPEVGDYLQLKSKDYEKWLVGMRRLRARAILELESCLPEDMYKLI